MRAFRALTNLSSSFLEDLSRQTVQRAGDGDENRIGSALRCQLDTANSYTSNSTGQRVR